MGLANHGSPNRRVVFRAYHKHLVEGDLAAHLKRKQLAHHAVVLSNLVLEAFHPNHSKNLLLNGRDDNALLWIVHIEDLILVVSRNDRVEQFLLLLDLLALEGHGPLFHEAFVLFVDVEFVIHGLDALFVEFFEVLAEGSGGWLGEEGARMPQEHTSVEQTPLRELNQFKHI